MVYPRSCRAGKWQAWNLACLIPQPSLEPIGLLFLVDFAARALTRLSSRSEVEYPVISGFLCFSGSRPYLSPLSVLDVASSPLWSCLLFLLSLLPSQRAPSSLSISCWARPLASGPAAGTHSGSLEVPLLPLSGLIQTRWTVLLTAWTLREATGQLDSWKGQGDHLPSL